MFNLVNKTLTPNQPTSELPAPSAPAAVARQLAGAIPETDGHSRLRFWRGDWYMWNTACWIPCAEANVRAFLYRYTELATYVHPKRGLVAWNPTKASITNVIDALGHAVLYRPTELEDDRGISALNGVVDLETLTVTPHHPSRFNLHALPFAYNQTATCPSWLDFLDQVLPGDEMAQQLIQEWFGYILAGDMEMQKILSMVGPPRSGKGTIARVLQAMLGSEAVTSPSLESLGSHFGAQPLIGKSLALISDARWNSRTIDEGAGLMLAIAGEDARSIAQKNRPNWEGRPTVRFMLMSNETPRWRDPSGAFASRLMHVNFSASFLGREDLGLTNRLLQELPGILNWAILGLDRLRARGYFVMPASSQDLIDEVARASSPVAGFTMDCLDVGTGETPIDDLYDAYRQWAKEEDGFVNVMVKTAFSRALSAHLNGKIGIKRVKPSPAEKQVRIVVGVSIQPHAIARSVGMWGS